MGSHLNDLLVPASPAHDYPDAPAWLREERKHMPTTRPGSHVLIPSPETCLKHLTRNPLFLLLLVHQLICVRQQSLNVSNLPNISSGDPHAERQIISTTSVCV